MSHGHGRCTRDFRTLLLLHHWRLSPWSSLGSSMAFSGMSPLLPGVVVSSSFWPGAGVGGSVRETFWHESIPLLLTSVGVERFLSSVLFWSACLPLTLWMHVEILSYQDVWNFLQNKQAHPNKTEIIWLIWSDVHKSLRCYLCKNMPAITTAIVETGTSRASEKTTQLTPSEMCCSPNRRNDGWERSNETRSFVRNLNVEPVALVSSPIISVVSSDTERKINTEETQWMALCLNYSESRNAHQLIWNWPNDSEIWRKCVDLACSIRFIQYHKNMCLHSLFCVEATASAVVAHWKAVGATGIWCPASEMNFSILICAS